LLFLLSFVLTILYRYLALRHSVLDIPNERSLHLIPTPKGGGIAIVITWYLGITVLLCFDFIPRNLYLALISGLILAIVGFIDDLYDLNPVIRLFAQIIAALLSLYFLKGFNPLFIGRIEIKAWFILIPGAVIGIIWFINLFNFLDGIDGYASLEASTIAFVMFFITGNPICLVLLASILGFLPWNWPKAKIFMGDVGSTQLGFVLIVLGIYFHNKTELSIIHWTMLSSLFWFDATVTLFRRWRNGENLSVAHKKHAYQRAVQVGYSHQNVIIMSFFINLIIIGLVFISKSFRSLILPMFLVNLLILIGITLLIDKKIPFK
jgi:UDP-N-acetylmuramyl pentapeptide phosphotransferase/UDP-N-acetylglucosamine-1-phosphate transferase